MMVFTVETLVQQLDDAPQISQEALANYLPAGEEGGFLLGGRRLPLAPMQEEDYLDQRLPELIGRRVTPLHWLEGKPSRVETPSLVTRKGFQTKVRDQLDRNTCASFAVVAAMEALLKGGGDEIDLSEQYLNWLVDGTQCVDFAQTWRIAERLEKHGICQEKFHKYTSRADATRECKARPSQEAIGNAIFGVEAWRKLQKTRITGPGIGNPNYLECLLAEGSDVVLELEIAWERNPDGVYHIAKGPLGAFSSGQKHAMLVVGYDRTGELPYFICKNSYGDSVEHSGYFHVSCAYVSLYSIRGLVLNAIRVDGGL